MQNNKETNVLDLLQEVESTVDKKFLNIEFWQSKEQIVMYCDAILHQFDPETEKSVEVEFKNDGVFVVHNTGYNHYVIRLPKVPSIEKLAETKAAQLKQDAQLKSIVVARAILLRHELAHILFTEDDVVKKYVVNKDIDTIHRFLEDSRIEHLFGKYYKGSYQNFIRLMEPFYRRDYESILSKPSFSTVVKYMQLRSYGFNFADNDYTVRYEEIYQKYQAIFTNENCDEVFNTFASIADDINKFLAEIKINEPAVEIEAEQNKRQTEIEEDIVDDMDDHTDVESSEDNNNDEEGAESRVASDEKAKDGEESDGCEESNGYDNDDENTDGADKDGDMVDSDTESNNEESESGEEEMVDGANRSNENGNSLKGDHTESENKKNNDESVDDETPDSEDTLSDLLQKTFRKPLAESSIHSTDAKINFHDMPLEATEIIMPKIFKIVDAPMRKIFNSNTGLTIYRQTVAQYAASINELTRLFKLKLQNRARVKEIIHQVEGDIDQNNLKEFVVRPQDPRGFMKSIKTITPKSNIIILLDMSISMLDHSMRLCISNAIILMEACKRNNINYSVSLFSQNDHTIHFTVKENRKFNPQAAINYTNINTNGNTCSVEIKEATLLTVKQLDDKHRQIHEILIGNILENLNNLRSVRGGTPEFEAVHYLNNAYKKINNKILFIINDGGFSNNAMNRLFSNELDCIYNNTTNKIRITESSNIESIIEEFMAQKKSIVADIKSNFQSYSMSEAVKLHGEQWVDDEISKIVDMMFNLIRRAKNLEGSKDQYDTYTLKDNSMPLMLEYSVKTCRHNSKEYEIVLSWSHNRDCKAECDVDYTFYNWLIGRLHYAMNDDKYSFIYEKYIEAMRTAGWKVLGIGIRSSCGQRYIGESNFTDIDDSNDLAKTFVKKLEKVF